MQCAFHHHHRHLNRHQLSHFHNHLFRLRPNSSGDNQPLPATVVTKILSVSQRLQRLWDVRRQEERRGLSNPTIYWVNVPMGREALEHNH
uniref:Uncharacterized protein n=1 Tax=Nelumbo nucifera TaxID=4432 RepID=A0A822XR40_NELNU|nr:TPA_asm: hypothetical protein HUJ06_022688 [Nelumbo nucifera]